MPKLHHMIMAALAGLTGTAAQAEWTPVSVSPSGSTFAMDTARIRDVGGKMQAWVQGDHARDRGVRYRKSLFLMSFNCEAQTYRILSTALYDSYGKVIDTDNKTDSYGAYGYEPILPDSLGEKISVVACAGK